MYKLLKVFCISVLFISCSSDDDASSTQNDPTAINLVTGINARQDNLSSALKLGNPNVRMPLNISSTSIIAFPNPVVNFLSIEIFQTNEIITDVWLVRAEANKIFENTDFNEVFDANTYTVNQVSQASIQSFNDLSNTNILLNLEGLETGYFRVFIKTDQNLYWDNIYLDISGVDINELFDFWD